MTADAFLFLSSFLLGQLALSSRAYPALQPPATRPGECRVGNVSMSASEQEVTDRFFKPYGNYQRPRLNASEPVIVSLRLFISGISDLIERQRLLVVNGWIQVRWMDEFRAWKDFSPYNCVQYIVIPAEEMWLPDLALMNSQGRYQLIAMEHEKVRIYSNGFAHYCPGGTFSAYCEIDLKLFPFDTQTCAIKMESWRYTRQYMMFEFESNVTVEYWTENEQWSLVSTSQAMASLSYLEPWNAFDHVEFYITMKRKIMYYMMNVILPSIVIAIAHIATFTLPVGAVERVSISFTCLLAYSVFQVMIVGDMPRSSDNIPLLTIYLDLQMAYIALSILGEGFCLYFLDKATSHDMACQKTQTVPSWLLSIANEIGFLLLLGRAPRLQNSVQQPSSSSSSSASTTNRDNNRITPLSLEDIDTSTMVMKENGIGSNGGINPVEMAVFTKGNHFSLSYHPSGQPKGCKCTRVSAKGRQWKYVSAVTERLVASTYLFSIFFTPLVMFGGVPFR